MKQLSILLTFLLAVLLSACAGRGAKSPSFYRTSNTAPWIAFLGDAPVAARNAEVIRPGSGSYNATYTAFFRQLNELRNTRQSTGPILIRIPTMEGPAWLALDESQVEREQARGQIFRAGDDGYANALDEYVQQQARYEVFSRDYPVVKLLAETFTPEDLENLRTGRLVVVVKTDQSGNNSLTLEPYSRDPWKLQANGRAYSVESPALESATSYRGLSDDPYILVPETHGGNSTLSLKVVPLSDVAKYLSTNEQFVRIENGEVTFRKQVARAVSEALEGDIARLRTLLDEDEDYREAFVEAVRNASEVAASIVLTRLAEAQEDEAKARLDLARRQRQAAALLQQMATKRVVGSLFVDLAFVNRLVVRVAKFMREEGPAVVNDEGIAEAYVTLSLSTGHLSWSCEARISMRQSDVALIQSGNASMADIQKSVTISTISYLPALAPNEVRDFSHPASSVDHMRLDESVDWTFNTDRPPFEISIPRVSDGGTVPTARYTYVLPYLYGATVTPPEADGNREGVRGVAGPGGVLLDSVRLHVYVNGRPGKDASNKTSLVTVGEGRGNDYISVKITPLSRPVSEGERMLQRFGVPTYHRSAASADSFTYEQSDLRVVAQLLDDVILKGSEVWPN